MPDGTLRRYRDGRTNILKINQTLGGRAFYEASLTNTFSEYHHYVYKNPFDPRYVHPGYAEANPPYTLNIAGNDLNRLPRYPQTNEGLAQFHVAGDEPAPCEDRR